MSEFPFDRRLARALALDLEIAPAELRRHVGPAAPEPRPASVLALFAGDPANPSLLLTRRTETVESHKGQIALPGGVRDPEDADDVATALRETEEEVGLPRARIRVVGRLPSFPTFTGFLVSPVVGTLDRWGEDLARLPLAPNPHEIAEVFWARYDVLTHPETYRPERVRRGGADFATHAYLVGPHRVWGITGFIVKNLLDRLAAVRLD